MLTYRARDPRGFTLIEASLAIVIVGTGVVSALMLFAACSRQNQIASRLTVATMLVRNVEEAMVHLPINDPIFGDDTFGAEDGEHLENYDDIDDFNGFTSASLAGPIDSLRRPVDAMEQYVQRVTVTPVQAANPTIEAVGSGAVRVDVAVDWRRSAESPAETLLVTSWYRMR